MLYISFTRRLSVLWLVATLATGCGGGGGGGTRTSTLNFINPTLLTTIDPSVLSAPTSPLINDLFARDINADGADEVLMAGRLSQPSTIHSDTRVSIFGFNTGVFADETSRWFNQNENIIVGSEPVVLFGNFTGHQDGRLDVLVAAGTDSNVTGPNVLFRNTGSDRFSRIELTNNIWLHGGNAGDINNDGIDDVLTIGYGWPGGNLILGGSNPTTRDVNFSGSDVTLGRFRLAGPTDNRVYAAVVDDSSNNGHFKFYSVNVNGSVDSVAVSIPVPDLGDNSHDIRVRTINLDGDGLPDLIVVSRPWAGINGAWDDSTRRMRVQFYRNLGSGEFAKDRDSFVRDGVTWQNPVVKDINADGVDDILLNSMTGGTTLLLGARDPATGRIVYAEAGTDVIRAFESNLTGFQRPVTIVRGLNGRNYLVGAQADNADRVHIFYSEIGSQGVYTVNSIVSTLKQSWPWLTDTEIQQILVRTGTSFQDGSLLDVTKAMRPAGGVFVKTAQGLQVLQGSFSGINLGDKALQILDGFGRNYAVPTQFMSSAKTLAPWERQSYDHISSFSFGQRTLVDINAGAQGWWAGHNHKNGDMAVGLSLRTAFGDVGIAGVQQNQNPWVKLSGVWGTTGRSFTGELSLSRALGPWSWGAGIMVTGVDMKPGLVTKLSQIAGAWAEAQVQLNETWSFASGVDPTIVSGYAEVLLPTTVSSSGHVNFSHEKVGLLSTPNAYARLSSRHKLPGLTNASGLLVARLSQDGKHRVSAIIRREF